MNRAPSAGEAVEVRRGHVTVAVAAERRPALVVGENEEDVRPCRVGGDRRRGTHDGRSQSEDAPGG